MPKYIVTGVWEHEESRVIEAKNPREAARKVAEGDYDDILGWNLTGLIGINEVELYDQKAKEKAQKKKERRRRK